MNFFGRGYLVALCGVMAAFGSPTPPPTVVRYKSDYPSIVPLEWPEMTSPPSPEILHDDMLLDDVPELHDIGTLSPAPSVLPSEQPSSVPSDVPSMVPSEFPSDVPSTVPSDLPSSVPSDMPSTVPSDVPSMVPSSEPSDVPSMVPSAIPSSIPSSLPSVTPSGNPTVVPSGYPTVIFEALGNFVIDDAPIVDDNQTPPGEGTALPKVPMTSKAKKGKSKMRRTAATKLEKASTVRLLRTRHSKIP